MKKKPTNMLKRLKKMRNIYQKLKEIKETY